MAYEKQAWVGTADPLVSEPGATSLSAARLTHLETQYDEVFVELNEIPSLSILFENGLA